MGLLCAISQLVALKPDSRHSKKTIDNGYQIFIVPSLFDCYATSGDALIDELRNKLERRDRSRLFNCVELKIYSKCE